MKHRRRPIYSFLNRWDAVASARPYCVKVLPTRGANHVTASVVFLAPKIQFKCSHVALVAQEAVPQRGALRAWPFASGLAGRGPFARAHDTRRTALQTFAMRNALPPAVARIRPAQIDIDR